MKALKSHPHIERPRRTLRNMKCGIIVTVVSQLATSAKTILPGDPFRLGRIRLSHVLWLTILAVMLGGLLEPEAAAQTVSFGAKTDFGAGERPSSVAVGDFNGDGKLDLVAAGRRVAIPVGQRTGVVRERTY